MSAKAGFRPSLPEVHGSVVTKSPSIWRRMFAFAGPAYLVSVGYMDPGNWATDLEGGARFGYQLLWVLVMSNLMAILLQTLSARLGIVSRRDLAQACRESYPRAVTHVLWFLCEIAIAACDLAEVLGAAIGLNLLFGMPLLIGVLLTAADTLLLLWFTRFGIRVIEGFILSLVAIVGGCLIFELVLARPVLSDLASGLVPRISGESLYVAIGILGATVMPHNLYLHSALVQTRRIGNTVGEKLTACRYNLVDSVVALNGALIVNAAILILAGTLFFQRGIVVTEIQQAHRLLEPLVGSGWAPILFGIALLCAGQSSTMTGTMAGQIVMEGFLNFRMRPWLRRLITRMVAVVPAAITIWVAGEHGTYRLLILSQVILSMQLPFAVIPLIHFTNDRKRMGLFANRNWVRLLALGAAGIIVILNIWLVGNTIGEWLDASGVYRPLVLGLAIPVFAALGLLLLWITLHPWLPKAMLGRASATGVAHAAPSFALDETRYHRILVPLDHTDGDRDALAHAASLAKAHKATIYLLHVEEDVTSAVYGDLSSTAEVEAGVDYLEGIAGTLRAEGIEVEPAVVHAQNPKQEIVRYAKQIQPDLVIMGAHGHRGIQDLVFGQTIDGVRHALEMPLLIVRKEAKPG
ncbi:MAG TPA: Nramp family divalent metal transporter [Bryobacteraceae bacterium]|nr:Nramp family divalent metal transporter [Bryobacteraceae bacterium]